MVGKDEMRQDKAFSLIPDYDTMTYRNIYLVIQMTKKFHKNNNNNKKTGFGEPPG